MRNWLKRNIGANSNSKLEQQTRRTGVGSGRPGGGRGKYHKKHLLADGPGLNHDTLSGECPYCFNQLLFEHWIRSDYGNWKDVWESWITDKLVAHHLKELGKSKRRQFVWPYDYTKFIKELETKYQDLVEDYWGELNRAYMMFDLYMGKHRAEDSTFRNIDSSYQFQYESASALPTPSTRTQSAVVDTFGAEVALQSADNIPTEIRMELGPNVEHEEVHLP